MLININELRKIKNLTFKINDGIDLILNISSDEQTLDIHTQSNWVDGLKKFANEKITIKEELKYKVVEEHSNTKKKNPLYDDLSPISKSIRNNFLNISKQNEH